MKGREFWDAADTILQTFRKNSADRMPFPTQARERAEMTSKYVLLLISVISRLTTVD